MAHNRVYSYCRITRVYCTTNEQTTEKMSKIKQTKIPMTLEDNVLKVALEHNVIENEFNWKLVRERDGLTT